MKVSVAPLMMPIVTTRGGDKPNHRVTIKLKRSVKLKWPTIDKLYKKAEVIFDCSNSNALSISSDGIELDREEEDDPIATRIKQEAVRLHRLYKSGETLEPLEVHRMACGLSSILNLTCTSQKQLFTDEEWNQLATRFTSIAIRYAPVDKKLMTNWALACGFSRSDGNAFRAMNHLTLTRTANFGNTSLYQKLMIMENILLTVQNESFLLSTLNEGTLSQLKKISEVDIFFKLWSPIINGLINVNKRLRLKSGDTVNLVSTAAKKQLYSEAQQVIGFKIDIRIVYDFEDEEIDLCAGEISKGTLNNAKVWHDDSKLIREGKDILNQLYDLCGNRENNELYSWSIQISGLQCVVSTQHLCSNGLYVSVPRFDFVFPKNLSSLDELDNMYKGLLTAIEDMERRSYLVENFLKQNQEQEQSNLTNVLGFNQFNDEDTSKVEEDVYSYKRPSWYTPPREERYKSVIPVHLFGRKRSATTISSISLSNPTTANNTVPDEYGFYECDGKYKNIEFPDLIFDTHPHQHE
ncbi:unnamed protein product [Mucor circinelloides]